MRKKLITSAFYSLLLTMVLFFLTSCNPTNVNDSSKSSNVDSDSLKPPLLSLVCEGNSSIESFIVKSTTFSWDQNGHGIDSDGPGPLDKTHPPTEIHLPTDSFLLSFAEKPDSYTVGYWTDDNMGKENPDFMTDLTPVDDRISLPDSSKGYVFKVHAIWTHGNASYRFHVIPD